MEIRNLQGLMQHWLPQVKGNTDALPAKAAAALQGSGVKVGADGVDMQADGEMKAALQRLQGVMQEQLQDVSELPVEVRKAVEAILEQYTQVQKVVPEGINAMLTSPRQAADLLSRLADALSEGAALKEEGGEAVKQLVDRLVSAFKETLPSSPGDLAAKLASLVQDINGRQGPLDKELTQLLQQLTAKMLRGNGTAGSAPEIGAPITSAAAATDALKQMAQSNEALLAVMKALTQEEGIGAALQEAIAANVSGADAGGELKEIVRQLTGYIQQQAAMDKEMLPLLQRLTVKLLESSNMMVHMPANEEFKTIVRQLVQAFQKQVQLDKEITPLMQQLTVKIMENNGGGSSLISSATATMAQTKNLEQSDEALLLALKALSQQGKSNEALPDAVRKMFLFSTAEGGKASLQQLAQLFQNRLSLVSELTQLVQPLTIKTLDENGAQMVKAGAPLMTAAAASSALRQMAQSNEALLAVVRASLQENGVQATGGHVVGAARPAVSEGAKAVLQQLVQAFQSQLPEELQSAGVQGQVLEGTRLWALLKTVESGATAGLNRQEFKASGETFRQLAAWLNGGAQGETPDLGELFGLVQFLPASAQQSVWSLARQQGLPDVLRQWAVLLGEGSANTADVPKELSSLQQRLGNSGEAARMANLLNEAADWLEGNSNRSLAAMGRMVKLLPPEVARLVQQVLAQDGSAEQLRNMGNLFTQLSEEAPQSQTLLFLRQAGAQAPAGGADGAAQTAQRLLALISQLASRQGQAEGELTQLLQQWQAKVQGDPAQTLLLERAVRQFGAQVPPDVAQTALKSNLPDLPKFWVLLKTMEAGEWNELPAQAQRKAADVVRELASSLQRPSVWEADVKTEHSLLTFTNTLLFDPQGTPYPMYWHLYHQQQKDAQGRDTGEFETWLRVCLETENMGTVDVVFRYYDEKALDVRLRFEGEEGAEAFREVLPEVRQAVGEMPFELGDIWVSRGGKKETKEKSE